MILDKFNVPFIDFVEEYFDISEHQFVFLQQQDYKYEMTPEKNVIWIDKKYKVVELLKYMYKADKIIVHGLWSEHLIRLLFLQPWLLKKCYHVMWGGDFYCPEKQSWIKKQVIKKIGHFITYLKVDYELAKQWYSTSGKYHECFMYPSNLYKEHDIQSKLHNTTNIQIGNSADPTNNHLEILETFEKYKDENIKIYVPLSYGNMEYAQKVATKGKEVFGDKFIAMQNFMPFEEYIKFLGDIDIAIFAHNRQQAMGNIITLLGLGKKIYMRSTITSWQLFKDIDVEVFDVDKMNLDLISNDIKKNNQKKIKRYFSKENLIKQLREIFE